MHIKLYFQNVFIFLITIVVIELVFNINYLSADCPYHLHYLDFSNSSKDVENHVLVQNTFDCYQNFKKFFVINEELNSCDDGDLDISFFPHSVLPNGSNMYFLI